MPRFGIDVVRVHLPWDTFMPSPRRVPASRLRDFETLLTLAAEDSLRVLPVLFAQSFEDCIMLPAYAIDVGAPRRGVRVVTDGVLQPGGPRDQYTDTLMIDSATAWLEQLLDAFAGHQAIAAWDLGHDPARTMRPRRITDMEAWVRLMSSHVHGRGERCALTLSSDDVVTGRAVRPHVLAPHLDLCGLALRAASSLRLGDAADAGGPVFVAQLMQRLLESTCPLAVHVDPRDEDELDADVGVARREVRDTLSQLAEVGSAALFAPAWADAAERAMLAPPLDHHPLRGRKGLVTIDGTTTFFGEVWQEWARQQVERQPAAQWPARLDIADYYANLPESVNELYAAWRGGQSDIPGMLD